MEEHIRALLQRVQYREPFKETAAFRSVFGGETLSQAMADLDIHNSYALRNWGSLYQRKVQTGLFVRPAMTRTQKRDVQALQQRNDELEQALQQANPLILARHTVMEVAEQERQLPIRKKSGPERSGSGRKTKSGGCAPATGVDGLASADKRFIPASTTASGRGATPCSCWTWCARCGARFRAWARGNCLCCSTNRSRRAGLKRGAPTYTRFCTRTPCFCAKSGRHRKRRIRRTAGVSTRTCW